MTSTALLLVLLVALIGLGVAGAVLGVDSRHPGGWTTRSDDDSLWPECR